MRASIIAVTISSIAFASVAACSDVAGVDVKYTSDASPSATTGDDAASAPTDGATSSLFDTTPEQVDGSAPNVVPTQVDAGPCDPDAGGCDITQGLGCCVPSGAAAPFCTDIASVATTCNGGLFVGCTRYDQGSESACCWSGTGAMAGGNTTYASKCDARPVACASDGDCNGSSCHVTSCKGITVGACGIDPQCPP